MKRIANRLIKYFINKINFRKNDLNITLIRSKDAFLSCGDTDNSLI